MALLNNSRFRPAPDDDFEDEDVEPRQPPRHAARRPGVRSEPLENGKRKERVQGRPRSPMLALSIVLLLFGGIGWIAGGKYTVEGWVVALNMFGRWIGLAQGIPMPRGWVLVIAVVVVSVIYSRVELLAWRKQAQRLPTFWIGWVLIVLTDVGSTLLGVLNPAPDAAPVFQQLAATVPAAILWSIILTAAPEYLILGGYRLLRG